MEPTMSGQINAPLPGTHWIGGWVGPKARLEAVEREISCPRQDSNPDSSVMHPDINSTVNCCGGRDIAVDTATRLRAARPKYWGSNSEKNMRFFAF
jgi:hypothetical protein